MIRTYFFLFLLTLFGLYFRFYNLSWGDSYFFHPDERNIASAISQIRFPEQMNPHFFAYGSLPIYAAYFTGMGTNSLVFQTFTPTVSFEQAAMLLRFFSAILSTALIPLVFFTTKKLAKENIALFAGALCTLSVGLIQFAHFGTFEIWLTFFSLLLFSICLDIEKQGKKTSLLYAGILTGLLVSIKISSLVLLPLPFFAYWLHKHIFKNKKTYILHLSLVALLICFLTATIFFITNPFTVSDFSAFRASMVYESQVATGKLPVFYTQEFFNTIPVFFQLQKVYPFLINPFLTVIFIPAFIFIIYRAIRKKEKKVILLILFFLFLLISQAFLFVKWTRYMIPTVPFIYICIALFLEQFAQKKRLFFTVSVLSLVSFLYAFSYLKTVLMQPDTRIMAAKWLQAQSKDTAITESYDLGTMLFNDTVRQLTYCNFYEQESTDIICQEAALKDILNTTQTIILPSQRVWKVRLENPKQFPKGYNFYSNLFNGKTQYKKIYKTPCDMFCTILYMGNQKNRNVFFEQTTSVFDRPVVTIFLKS